jgi:hypothetical protein
MTILATIIQLKYNCHEEDTTLGQLRQNMNNMDLYEFTSNPLILHETFLCTRVLFSGYRIPFLASEATSLLNYTNQN